MAYRRRVKRAPERAWMTTGLLTSFTTVSPVETGVELLIAYSDIDDENDVLVKERSEFYLERLLGWYQPTFFASDVSNQFRQPLTGIRIGTFETQDTPVEDDPRYQAIEQTPFADEQALAFWAHVLHENCFTTWNSTAVQYAGAQVPRVDDEEDTLTGQGFALPLPTYHFDVSPNIRLSDVTNLYVQWGWARNSSVGENSFTWGLSIYLKALWRRSWR